VATAEDPLRVAVVRLPRISNFTDVDALGLEPDVDVRFAARPADVADADLIVVPGTRSTSGRGQRRRRRGDPTLTPSGGSVAAGG
jgi:adenosylcobyric acid synthase